MDNAKYKVGDVVWMLAYESKPVRVAITKVEYFSRSFMYSITPRRRRRKNDKEWRLFYASTWWREDNLKTNEELVAMRLRGEFNG
jgi:hypothetical protein